MGKKKPVQRKSVPLNNNPYAKPAWMKVTKAITLVLLGLFTILVLAGLILKYYRSYSNHTH